MVEKRIVEQCAPTLAGIKCGCLFRIDCNASEIASELIRLNDVLNPKGVAVTMFIPSVCGTFVYVHRTRLISEIKGSNGKALDYLKRSGYDISSDDALIESLRSKIESVGCVPHEIGIFLGYPLDDVKGFIENKGRCPKCMGCWKVYGSEEVAAKMFEDIRECRKAYSERYRLGVCIEELTVSTA